MFFLEIMLLNKFPRDYAKPAKNKNKTVNILNNKQSPESLCHSKCNSVFINKNNNLITACSWI